ncbi:MAG: S-layer homology domain-containing protein, partial [Schwartzia sp.]|nr:S-layer homology domain-containing protein [Schwartzia sp. (in: firmicutes)]
MRKTGIVALLRGEEKSDTLETIFIHSIFQGDFLMKKFFVSVAAASLIAGSAASAFAAANPFEDVPADHWAYDAVAQLASDGVVEGYGDGSYRGDQEITRYEMAQM